ncbi:MAG: M24 family metallopeptidase [Actinomycetota bacterium]
MWAAHLMGLQGAMPDAAFVPASPVLSRLRAVKDDHELELLSRAARGADDSFRRIVQLRLEGPREEEVARCLSELLVEHGHDRAELTIVASGPNGASSHHEPGGRTIRPGDPVVMDFGGALAGFFSDTTRTVCLGEPPPGFLEVYELVREAQEEAFRAVAPGVPVLPGMCSSIEPGIYLEGQFGVRIEDVVTVTAEGGARLNRTSRELRRL